MLSLALLLSAAAADVTISRTVDELAIGTAVITIDGSACASVDAYGSNDCDLTWGSAYTGRATVNVTQDIVEGSQLIVDTKVDRCVQPGRHQHRRRPPPSRAKHAMSLDASPPPLCRRETPSSCPNDATACSSAGCYLSSSPALLAVPTVR